MLLSSFWSRRSDLLPAASCASQLTFENGLCKPVDFVAILVEVGIAFLVDAHIGHGLLDRAEEPLHDLNKPTVIGLVIIVGQERNLRVKLMDLFNAMQDTI
jgi:hypothetical protein